MKTKSKDQELNETIYSYKNFPFIRILLAILILFPLGLIINLPIKKLIVDKIDSEIRKNKSCPIFYQNTDFSIFPPKLSINKPTIMGKCFSRPRSKLELDNINIALSGPSFSPVGLKFTTTINYQKTPIKSYLSISPFGHVFKIDRAKIQSSLINTIVGEQAISGHFTLNALGKATMNGTIESGSLHLKSKNLAIRSLSLQQGLFTVPSASLGNLSLKATIKGADSVLLKELIIGDQQSPIQANFTGNIGKRKTYQVQGKFKLDDQFISKNNLGIINLLLQGKPKTTEGAYQVKLSGTLQGNSMPKYEFF